MKQLWLALAVVLVDCSTAAKTPDVVQGAQFVSVPALKSMCTASDRVQSQACDAYILGVVDATETSRMAAGNTTTWLCLNPSSGAIVKAVRDHLARTDIPPQRGSVLEIFAALDTTYGEGCTASR